VNWNNKMTKKEQEEWQKQLEIESAEARGLSQGEFQGRVISELRQLSKGNSDLYDKYNYVIKEVLLLKGKAIGYSAVVSLIIAIIGIFVKWKTS